MFPLEKERERLEQEGKIETPEMRVLHGQFAKDGGQAGIRCDSQKARQLEKEGKAYTEEYKAFEQKSREVYSKYREYQNEYIQSNPTLVGLYLLTRQAKKNA